MHLSFRDGANLVGSSRERSGALLQSLRGNVFVAMASLKKMLFGLGSLDFRKRDKR